MYRNNFIFSPFNIMLVTVVSNNLFSWMTDVIPSLKKKKVKKLILKNLEKLGK